MAHHPMWRPDSAKNDSAKIVRSDAVTPETGPPEIVPPVAQPSGAEGAVADRGESDFAELAAKFAAHGGGKIPAELSGELALDVVLNEIVEQACQATGASGAAIALRRGEEMVCRASSGGNAPQLGTRLDTSAGLSGACVRTRQVQCCDDALTDARADAEISRQLKVRSVVVQPLLHDEELIGIFEIFWSLPAAFGEHDLRTLQVLADRVLKNAQARQASLAAIGLAPPELVATSAVHGTAEASAEQNAAEIGNGLHAEVRSEPAQDDVADEAVATLPEPADGDEQALPAQRFDWFTILAGVLIILVVLLMGSVLIMRLGWVKMSIYRTAPRAVTLPSSASSNQAAAAANKGNNAGAATLATKPSAASGAGGKSTSGQTAAGTVKAQVPEGSLRVYQNGKEIFRMPPAIVEAPGGTGTGPDVNAALPPERVAKVPADAAEGSLLRRVEPQYPEQARSQRVQGPVVLDVHIGRTGAVQEVKLVSGDPLLAEAAIAAVRQWRFKPHTLNGQAVDMETEITLKFTLPPN